MAHNMLKNLHFRTVSISAPARRAALTAFSSLRAAAVGAFLRITTGSQSCDIPDIFSCFLPHYYFFSLMKKFCARCVFNRVNCVEGGGRSSHIYGGGFWGVFGYGIMLQVDMEYLRSYPEKLQARSSMY